MADYTTEEITTAVEKIVRSAIRRQYGLLGNRDIRTSFNDLQDAVAGLLTLNPNSPFYVVFLGTERLNDLLEPIETTLVSLIEAIENTDRNTTNIDNLTYLENARVALASLRDAAASRTRTFDSVEDVPAFKRYNTNLQRFLDESSANVRKNGAIVPTPEQARAEIPGLVTMLQSQHAVIVSRSTYLKDAIDDYDNLRLPSLMSAGVIARAQEVLTERVEELEALSPSDRLQKVRDVTLDILAGRAAVKGVGSLKSTTIFALLEGTGQVFADASHPATSAIAIADIAGPYAIIPGESVLHFGLDSSFYFSITIPPSYLAEAQSSIPETYNIVAATNDRLLIEVDGYADIDVNPLAPGAARTAAQIVSDINGAIGAQPVVAEVGYRDLRFIGVVDIEDVGGPPGAKFILPSPGVWEDVRAQVGDFVRVEDSSSAYDGQEFVVSGVAGDTLTTTGIAIPTPETLKKVRVGLTKVVKIRVADGQEEASLNARLGVTIKDDDNNTSIQTLGFIRGGVYRCLSTSAQFVANEMNSNVAGQQAGVPRLSADIYLTDLIHDGLGRSDPDDPGKIVAYKYRERGSCPDGLAGAPMDFAVAGADTAGVANPDVLVVRESTIQGDVNVKGVVQSADDEKITAIMDEDISASAEILVEVGEDFTVGAYQELEVTDSENQDGTYNMAYGGQGTIPFEFAIEGGVPLNRAQGGLPQFFSLRIGNSAPRFSSTRTLLDTKVEIDTGVNPAVDKFFTTVPAEAVGTTRYFQLPEDPGSLSEGDQLELYETSYNQPSSTHEVSSLELDLLLMDIDPGLDTDFGTIAMSNSSPVPFGRIRLLRKNNYTVLEEALVEWLDLDQNQGRWFTELNRLLNPLLVNRNPTSAQVNAAKLHVQLMLGVLTESGAESTGQPVSSALEAILGAYRVAQEDDVDTLVSAYLDRGSDRGIDILLQGRFTDFFGLTVAGMSYAGAVQEQIREIAQEDLPVRRTGREAYPEEQIDASYEDVDYEFDFSDVDNFDEDIELPAEFSKVTSAGL